LKIIEFHTVLERNVVAHWTASRRVFNVENTPHVFFNWHNDAFNVNDQTDLYKSS